MIVNNDAPYEVIIFFNLITFFVDLLRGYFLVFRASLEVGFPFCSYFIICIYCILYIYLDVNMYMCIYR